MDYRIAIETDSTVVYDWTGTAANPTAKVWDGTYEVGGTVPDGDYTVNVTGTSTTTGLSVNDNTEVITVTSVPDEEPPVISDVASSDITENSATITWDTDENSDSLVKYGTTPGVYTMQEYDAADVTAHSIDLTGLSANTTYYYVVNSTDPSDNPAQSGEYSFTTSTNSSGGVFDTRSGTYPSISGTHNGTITPSCNLTVSKLYTYPCTGTGGHAEYVKIWNSTGWNVTATWSGYVGDWHNISFNKTFTLFTNETYNFTIRTGSYPQIIHEHEFNATGGTITRTNFTDANGVIHYGWIPAIRLWS